MAEAKLTNDTKKPTMTERQRVSVLEKLWLTYYNDTLYEKGLITEEEIRTACEHLFRTRFRLGLFDEQDGFEGLGLADIANEEHATLALRCAEKGMVLLKNDGILPLDETKLRSVAVIGPNATSIDALRGNYYGTSCRNVTFLDGISQALAGKARVYYSEGCALNGRSVEYLAQEQDRLAEAKAMAEAADVTILCLGLDATIEGEEGDEGNAFVGGDKTTLALPACQQELLDAVLGVSGNVIVVLAVGSSLNIGDDRPRALLQTWYPGEAGGTALANLLFGKAAPSGKLPVTFYESADRLPDFSDYSMKDRTYRYTRDNVLYPFGYGLTYGELCAEALTAEEGRATITVANTGTTDCEDVLQLYIRDEGSPHEVPYCRLCGFLRVKLRAGERGQFVLPLEEKCFTVVNDDGQRVPGSGKYRLWAGFCSPGQRGEELTGKSCLSTLYTR